MATEIATRSPAFVDGKTQNAQDLRLHVLSNGGGATPLASRGGIRPSGGQPGLIAALPTPVMKVRVNAGIADIPSASASGGVYRVSWDQVDLDIDPSSAQARTDLVIVEVVDTGTAAATGKVRILRGQAGAGRPGNPTPNAHWETLGSVAVRTAAESSGNIRAQDVTPERRYAVAPGAPIPVSNQTERDALTGYNGLQVFRLDTGVYETYWQGSWRPNGSQLPTIRVHRSAAGSLNYIPGQFIAIPYEQIDPAHGTHNPDGLFVHKASERRVQVTRAGLYLLQAEVIGTAAARLRVVAMPTAGATPGTAYGTNMGGESVNVSATVRLAAGDHVGGAVMVAADVPDNTNGYRNGLTITRLSD